MAVDDTTSQDSVVIGDDLVEALGFEPVEPDESLDDRQAGGSELVVLDGSDLEAGLEVLDEMVLDAEVDVAADVGVVDLTDPDEKEDDPSPASDTDGSTPGIDPATDDGATTETASNVADPAAEVLAAEAVDDEALTELAAASVETAPESVAEQEEVAQVAEPLVFFNNGIDTDTAPLASTDRADAGLDEDFGPEVQDDDGSAADALVEMPPPPTAADALVEMPPPPTAADAVIVLPLVTEPDADDAGEIDIDGAQPAGALTADLDSGRVGPLNGEEASTAVVAARTLPRRRKKLRARKSRRVVRHIDPWSVLTFSVLFHLCFFAALLLASVLVWNAALAAGTIENIESFIRELGDYETFEINSDEVFKAAVLIGGLLTLASSVLVVLLTVVFNLISDLIGGIRITVIEEETVRIPKPVEK